MTISAKEKEEWKAAIFKDYPRLREMPDAVNILFDLYTTDPDKFKRTTKELEHKEAKKARKQKSTPTEPPTPKEPIIIEGAIQPVEDWPDKGPETHITHEPETTIVLEDGMIKNITL